jgi:signal transduction histidine kinase
MGTLVMVSDVTTRRQMERALACSNRELARSNAELSTFAAVAKHDLRAPLASIGGFAELLGARYGEQLGDRGNGFVTNITTAVARQQQLIDDLLAYARAGGPPPTFAPVNATALLDRVTLLLAADIAAAGTVVQYMGLPILWGDQGQPPTRFGRANLRDLPAPLVRQSHTTAPLQKLVLTQGHVMSSINRAVRSIQDVDLQSAEPDRTTTTQHNQIRRTTRTDK